MKRILLMAVAMMAIFFQGQAKTENEIKLISYNIRTAWGRDGNNSWDYRKTATTGLFQKESPDVIGLQEAMKCQLDYIDYTCPEYAHVGEDRDGGIEGGETMAIYYRKEKFDLVEHGTFWLSESPDIVSRGWDAACNRTVTWVKLKLKGNNKSFYYFNTHLDHQGKIARSKSIELITEKIQQIAGKKPVVILGGDMNSSLDSPVFKPILRYMKPAREKAKQTDHQGTFNGFGSAPDTIILDHLFYRGRMKCKSFRTLTDDYGAPYISDHYPIEIIFAF